MAKYIGVFSDTIDDIELNGFVTMTDKEMDKFEELASSITWDFTYKVGDAELEYTSGDDLLTRIDFREISNEQHKALINVFDGQFGVFIGESYLIEVIGDEDSDDEDYYDDEDDNIDYEY
jgi:hypothetical protein